MQPPPYNLNKELPIPNGSPNRRRPSNNHRKGNKNATNGPKTTSNNSSNNLLAKLSALNPLRSQPTTPTRADSFSPFRIVHVPDRTPPYVPPGPREPKTNVECREALEEMYAISKGQQEQEQEQGHATEENGDNSRTGLQMHLSNSYQHHRYVSIIQGTNSGYLEEEKEEIVWISRTKPRDVKKRTRQMADSGDGSSFSRSSSGGDGASNKKPPRRPPPPLPLHKDTKYTRSILSPGRLHIPPPPSTPNSAGPALETIPASPASPSSTPMHDADTTTTTTATNFSWRGLTSAPLPLPSTPTTPSPPRAGGNNNMRRDGGRGPAGGRGHERVGSTGGSSSQGPLRAPRPLSERPLISPMSLSPQRPVTTRRSGLGISPSRSPPVKLSQAATTVTTPVQPTFDGSRRSSSGSPREERPIELRGYDELTTRRSRPRIPICSVTEGGDFQHVIGDGGDVISRGSSQKSDHDGESWRGSGIAAPPVIPATRNRPGVSVFTTSSSTAPENDKLGLVCTTTPNIVGGGGDHNRDTWGGNCQDDYSLLPSHHHNNRGGGGGDDDDEEQEYFEYSDSEYDETTPSSYSGHRRTLSPTMKKFPLPPSPIIAPTRPLRCGGGGGDWVAPWTPTRSPRGQMDFSPASPIPSSEETKTTFFVGSSSHMTPPPPPPPLPTTTMGWSRMSSSSPAATARQQQQPPGGGAAASPTPPSPHLLLPTTTTNNNNNNSPRPFSPPPARYNYYYPPGLRKGSTSSSSSNASSYLVGGSSVVNEPPSRTRKSSSALFHLERSIANDPSWSPLVPPAGGGGGAWPPVGHEVLRLGRVPSGEGHQVFVVVGSSADCSSRESSNSSSRSGGSSSSRGGGGGDDGEREEQPDEGGEGGVAAATGSVQRPTWLAPREGGGGNEGAQQGGDVLGSGGGIDDGSTTDCYYHGHHDGEEEIYHHYQPENSNTNNNSNSAAVVNGTSDEREAGGSYGDWFSYYAEETRQNNAAAAARYVHPLSDSFFFSSSPLPYFRLVPRLLISKTGAGS